MCNKWGSTVVCFLLAGRVCHYYVLLCLCVDDSIPCPDLEDPLNGQVRSDGVRAMYSCQDSYILVGTSVRECSIEVGEWLGNEPQCSNGQLKL